MKNDNLKPKQAKDNLVKSDVNRSFYVLIDRLQSCMQKKYPERGIWDNDTYYGIAFEWMGKDTELLKRVLELEKRCVG